MVRNAVFAWTGFALLVHATVVGCTASPPSAPELGGGPAPLADASASGFVEAAADGGKDAETDTDADVADATSCLGEDLVPGEPADGGIVCPSSGPCSTACSRLAAHYKAGVAQAAASCIMALPSCTDALDVVPCVDKALADACSDPTSPNYCAPLVTACDPDAGGFGSIITQEGCESFANGLSDAGRAVFAACIQDKISSGTCAVEVGSCGDEIRQ